MKIIIILIVLSTASFEISAVFFHSFHHSFVTVEQHLGRLLTRGVEDFKTTIDCTVLAIENVLSWGGSYHTNSNPNSRCDVGRSGQRYPRETTTYSSVAHKFGTISKDIGKRTENWRAELSHGIKNSISRINESLNELIDRDATGKLEYVRDELRNETDRLLQVSLLLRKELDRLSTKADSHIKSIDFNPYNASTSDIAKELRILHDYEKSEDPSGRREVQNVYNKVWNTIHFKDTSNSKKFSQRMTTEQMYDEIAKELKRGKLALDDKAKSSNNKHSDAKPTEKEKTQNNNFSSSSKDLFNNNHGEPPLSTPSSHSSTKDKEVDFKNIGGNELLNYYFPQNVKEEHEKVVKEAQDVFEQGEKARNFMDNLFSNLDKLGKTQNVFESSDLLNSG